MLYWVYADNSIERFEPARSGKNIEWLTIALTAAGFSDTKAKANALHIFASLEGAMIVSKSLGEDAVFESVAKTLVKFAGR